jgi:putative ABC transport system substrate-binding protein
VVAVGAKAAELARGTRDLPLVYAMVLDPRALGLPAPGDPARPAVSGVTMEVGAERQFETFRRLTPSVRRIGVLHDPALSGPSVRAAVAAARAQGLDLRAVPVRDEGEVLAQARLLLPQVDALWAMADPTVLTAANARALILLSLRSRKPVFAVSEGFVRSGALAAVSADPEAVGRRAGEMALSLLEAPLSRALAAEPPPRVSLSVIVATARNLALELPAELLREAEGIYPRSNP